MSTIETKLDKVVRIGSIQMQNRAVDVFCKIEVESGKLSICGVEGPTTDGNCKGGCGQIDKGLWENRKNITLAPGWGTAMLDKFLDTWHRWHLNDLRAGSPAQEAWLRENPIPEEETRYPKSHYEVACVKLAAAGLNPDNGYSYGNAWNTEALPDEVVSFLESLPDTDKTPAWV